MAQSKQELELEIKELEQKHQKYVALEQSHKILLNSIYGAFGSPYFAFFNVNIAKSITLQGQDLIKYSAKIINKYFTEIWHKDKELHDKLGIKVFSQIPRDVNVYGDTDSEFIEFNSALLSCNWKGNPIDFFLQVYEHRLKEYIKKRLIQYAEHWNTENVQEFELESISRAGIWLGRKKYVMDLSWKDPGIFFDDGKIHLKYKGIEIVQSSSSQFAREYVPPLIEFIMEKKKTLDIGEFTRKIYEYQKVFKMRKIDDIAVQSSIGDYEKFVLDDQEKIVLEKGCPVHVRAAATYNHHIRKTNNLSRYKLLKTGDKIKWYVCKDDVVFGYPPNEFPYQSSPPEVDYIKMFDKSIIKPINRFVSAVGFEEINNNLIITTKLF